MHFQMDLGIGAKSRTRGKATRLKNPFLRGTISKAFPKEFTHADRSNPWLVGCNQAMMLDGIHSLTHYCKFSDERGGFEGIINQGIWQEINIVHTHAGCMRGGHYHRQTTEVIFLITGMADVELSSYDDLTTTSRISLMAGEGIQIPPMTVHRFFYLKQSSHVQLLDQRFDPSNQDLFSVNPVHA